MGLYGLPAFLQSNLIGLDTASSAQGQRRWGGKGAQHADEHCTPKTLGRGPQQICSQGGCPFASKGVKFPAHLACIVTLELYNCGVSSPISIPVRLVASDI